VLNTYFRSRNRWFSLGFLLVLSCAAIGRSPQEVGGLDRQAWPKEIQTSASRITVYEPQLESFKGNRLNSRAAVSVIRQGDSQPVFGGVWLESTLITDPEGRTATPVKIQMTAIRFPNSDASELAELRREIEAAVPRWKLAYSLDAVLAELKLLEERKALAQGLKADVPQIFFRSRPAVLLSMQGEPIWRPLAGKPYQRLENSAFFVLQESATESCYLHIPPFWWKARGPLDSWQAIEEVPRAVAELWTSEPKPQLLPAEAGQVDPQRPEVIPASQPAELVWTDGLPQFSPITGTNLLYVKNTESDVFLDIETQFSYVLLSGRWYRTASGKVDWEFVPSEQLPADFRRIPLGSEKQHVLACVAGTAQARAAVLDAEIPQTEAVQPGPAPGLAATYDGSPRFTEIPDCSVQYAVNTPCSIFLADRRYYWCQDGIWYDSDFAVGPWFVCSWVPPVIYLIPPSCPHYCVTYCHVFSATAGAICVGYYPGYLGCYVWGRSVVYGTGWQYRCWSGSACYSRPVTWGAGVRYNPLSCSWTIRLGGGATCAWAGLGHFPGWRSPTLSVGVGGGLGGIRHGNGYRNAAGVDVVLPLNPGRPDNLYAHHLESIARPVAPDSRRTGNPTSKPGWESPGAPGSDRHAPQAGGNDAPRTPPTPGRREDPRPPSQPTPQDPSRAPVPPPHHDAPKTPPSPSPRENPRGPSSAPDREAPTPAHEIPRKPPPPSDRGVPRTPPPSSEHRESPKVPPLPREIPRTPAPPPPVERREAPRNPPSPPTEHREAPRNPPPPPPPPHREAPKDPPPSGDRRR
jgi:hypothetical protein